MHVVHHSFFQLPAEHHRSPRMRTDTAQPIRLQDYRPPEWLVDRVSLDVSLHPRSGGRRAPVWRRPTLASAAAPLVLDGDGLSLVSLKLDGAAVPDSSFVATPD